MSHLPSWTPAEVWQVICTMNDPLVMFYKQFSGGCGQPGAAVVWGVYTPVKSHTSIYLHIHGAPTRALCWILLQLLCDWSCWRQWDP